MTSGAKINHAKDNAANYSIATNMTTKINAYMVAEDNCAMGLDLVSTASSSLELVSDLTSRLRALATQAQNGTYGSSSISAINSEAKAIIKEMNRIKNTTQFNGVKLLGDSAQTANDDTFIDFDEETGEGLGITGTTNSDSGVNLTLQVGINSSASSQISISIAPLDISVLDGLDLTDSNSLSIIDEILNTINNQQTELGAVQNRLESALDSIAVSYDNLVSSRSTIQDADIAELSSEYIKMQILQQASATLMATANQSPSIALQLL